MAKVKVKIYTVLNKGLVKGDFDFEATTVADVFENLVAKYQQPFRNEIYDSGQIKNNYVLLVNGEPVERENLERVRLKDGDLLLLFPPVSGG
ncbi:MAG: MoaD/ThiS family protein [Planctomycetota bacterium]|nr:MoaD/ThiS family protein [Planctomycetota bacterium]